MMWTFTLRLDREPTDAETDALFEAGLDDSMLGGSLITVDREKDTLLGAIISAVAQIRSVGGPAVVGVVTEEADAVTLTDISTRLGGRRTAESLRLLATGKRGPGGFPLPLLDTGKIKVYSWSQVTAWLRTVLGEIVPEPSPDLALADQALRLAAWARAEDREQAVRQLM